MSTFATHFTYTLNLDGSVERRTCALPSVITVPPVRVSLNPELTLAAAAKLLRALASELEAMP